MDSNNAAWPSICSRSGYTVMARLLILPQECRMPSHGLTALRKLAKVCGALCVHAVLTTCLSAFVSSSSFKPVRNAKRQLLHM